MKKTILALCLSTLVLLAACHSADGNKPSPAQGTNYAAVDIPAFNADSAFAFTAAQLDFGFRAPGHKGHDLCAAYLEQTMRRWCDTVIVQPFNTTLWNGQAAKGKNIIASINPSADKRVLLAAHWDSRLWADQDPDSNNHRSPIMGANDGASGVGALMEMARTMAQQRPSVGIDFIFFDLEDQGTPTWGDNYDDNAWCKGSQHWAQNPHRPYYKAVYGVLFDMVGTDHPRFTKEEVSRRYAPGITKKLWEAAAAMGYSNVFVDVDTPPILDDHMYVNQIMNLPMADIVQNSPDRSFYEYWHTVRDDINSVNRQSLKLVADVTMKVIYADYPAQQ